MAARPTACSTSRRPVAYGYQDTDVTRLVALPTGDVVTGGDADGHVVSGSLEVRANVLGAFASQFVLAPTATVDAAYVERDGLRENGRTVVDLVLQEEEASQVVTGVGVTLGGASAFGTTVVTAELQVLYEHVFGDTSITQTASFAGTTPAFATSTAEVAEDRLRLEAGLGVAISERLDVTGRYEGSFAEDFQSHGGSVGLTLRF